MLIEPWKSGDLTNKNADWTMKSGDFTNKNADWTMKSGDLTNKKGDLMGYNEDNMGI